MKVRDLLEQEADIDVYDNVCDDIGIAFCGPMKLTPEGEQRFAEVLDYKVELVNYSSSIVAIVVIDEDDPEDKLWEERLEKAKEFFEAAAGYCSVDEYDAWFEELDD